MRGFLYAVLGLPCLGQVATTNTSSVPTAPPNSTTTSTTTATTATTTLTTKAPFTSPGLLCWGETWDNGFEPPSMPPVKKIFTGGFGHCAILEESGLATCWGPWSDQLEVPSDLGPVTDIAIEDLDGACAITEAGTLRCWGGFQSRLEGLDMPGNLTQVVMSDDWAAFCVLDASGDVHCFGPDVENYRPVISGPVVQLAQYNRNYCALNEAGMVKCAYTWGTLGYYWEWNPDFGRARRIAVGYESVCAVMEEGYIKCQPEKKDKAGEPYQSDHIYDVPEKLTIPGQRFRDVYAGFDFYCAWLEDEDVPHCWGHGVGAFVPPYLSNVTAFGGTSKSACAYGEFGTTAETLRLSQCEQSAVTVREDNLRSLAGDPTLGSIPFKFCAPESGGYMLDTCSSNISTTIVIPKKMTWWTHVGRYTNHQGGCLTDGPDGPVGAVFGFDITAGECLRGHVDAATGGMVSLTLRCVNTTTTTTTSCTTETTTLTRAPASKAHIECWGGIAARGIDGVEITSPRGPFNALAISAGPRHNCAVREDGTPSCWPHTFGLGDIPDDLGPVLDVKVHGYAHPSACAITQARTVRCWGTRPPAVPRDLGEVMSLAVGSDHHGKHVCAALADGTVTCFGEATGYGVLNVPNLTDVVQVDAGGQQTCALHQTGSITCWGRINDFGQPDPSWGRAVSISVGTRHACAVLEDAEVKCWGDEQGQPFDVPQGFRSTMVSVGNDYACGISADMPWKASCWGDHDRLKHPTHPISDWWENAPPFYIDQPTMLSVGDTHVCAVNHGEPRSVKWPNEIISCDNPTVSGSTVGKPKILTWWAGEHPFKFCAPITGTYTFDTCGANWNTEIGVYVQFYTGEWYHRTAMWNGNSDDADCGRLQSRLTGTFDAGWCYYVHVTGYYAEGDFTLRLTCPDFTSTLTTSTRSTSTVSTSTRTTATSTSSTTFTGTTSVTSHTNTSSTTTTASSTTTSVTATTTPSTSLTATSTSTSPSSMTTILTTPPMTTHLMTTTSRTATSAAVQDTTATATTTTATSVATLTLDDMMAAATQAEEALVQELLGTGDSTSKTVVPGGVTVASRLTGPAGSAVTVALEDSVVQVDVPAGVLAQVAGAGEEAVLVLTKFDAPVAHPTLQGDAQGALRIEFFAIGNTNTARRVSLDGLSEPVEFVLPIAYKPDGLECGFFDETLQQWSTRGVSLSPKSVKGEPLVCLTVHLSLFGALPVQLDTIFPLACSDTAGALGTILLWSITGVCVLLLLAASRMDFIRARTVTWLEEYLLIPEAAGESESPALSFFMVIRCALSTGCASLGARGRTALGSFFAGCCAGPKQVGSHLLMLFARKAAGAALRLSDDLINLALEDQVLRDMLVERKNRIEALGPAEFEVAKQRESALQEAWASTTIQEDLWAGLHAVICQSVVRAMGRSTCTAASQIFLVQNPFGMLLVADMYTTRKMKAFFVLVHMAVTMALSAVFLKASGLLNDDCSGEQADRTFGLPIAIATGAYLCSQVFLFVLKSFRTRTFTKVQKEGCPEWFLQLRAWTLQDIVVITLGLAVGALGLVTAYLQLDGAGSESHLDFAIGALTASTLDFFLLPLLVSFAPVLLNKCFLSAAVVRDISTDFANRVPVSLDKALGKDPERSPDTTPPSQEDNLPSPSTEDLASGPELQVVQGRIKASL